MRQLKESGDDLDVAVHRQTGRDQALCPAVEQNHDNGKQKMGGARGVVGHSKNWPDSILIGIILSRKMPRFVTFPSSSSQESPRCDGYGQAHAKDMDDHT